MASFLIDYENVCGKNGFAGIENLQVNDRFFIFYSEGYKKVKFKDIKKIEESGCDFEIVKLVTSRSNALDFYIATKAGELCVQGETQICIVTEDKGFRSIVDYIKSQHGDKVSISTGPNIEAALAALKTPGDVRCLKVNKLLEIVDLEVEYARIKERNQFQTKLREALIGTEYNPSEVINFMEYNDLNSKNKLYRQSMHHFGRETGQKIYRVIRDVLLDSDLYAS